MGWKIALFGFIVLIFAITAMVDRFPSTGRAAQVPQHSCADDAECVPAACCHAAQCVPLAEKPDCAGVACTLECQPGTLDCGQLRCGCVAGKCVMKLF